MSKESRHNPDVSDIEMYFSKDVVEKFAQLEQNEKNFSVANIADLVIMEITKDFTKPLYAAELGGGAHPDRYHRFFDRLLSDSSSSHIDWVDISPYMLNTAKKYLDQDNFKEREKVINFIEKEILGYLKDLDDNVLDLGIMKYTIDHIKDIDTFFQLISSKLKYGGKLFSTLGVTSPELKSISTNARFLYNGEEFPENEVRILKEGDNFTVKFFKVSGKPEFGYLPGAQATKYYYSMDKFRDLAKKNNLEIFIGDWKEIVEENKKQEESIDLKVLILTKIK